jgi:hypothetical protein
MDLDLETLAERTSYMQRLEDERVSNRKKANQSLNADSGNSPAAG